MIFISQIQFNQLELIINNEGLDNQIIKKNCSIAKYKTTIKWFQYFISPTNKCEVKNLFNIENMASFTISEKELKKYLSNIEYYLVHEKFLISNLNKNTRYLFEKM